MSVYTDPDGLAPIRLKPVSCWLVRVRSRTFVSEQRTKWYTTEHRSEPDRHRELFTSERWASRKLSAFRDLFCFLPCRAAALRRNTFYIRTLRIDQRKYESTCQSHKQTPSVISSLPLGSVFLTLYTCYCLWVILGCISCNFGAIIQLYSAVQTHAKSIDLNVRLVAEAL